MHSHRIHIVCRKQELAALIAKALMKEGYLVSSTSGEGIRDSMIHEMNESIECLIFDKDIEDNFKGAVREKFKTAKVICLPSLEAPGTAASDVEYMSEPFRLSELTNFVNNLFNVKAK